jgi:3-oxoacyl-[acyl-carrier protein] reductase
MSAPAPLGDRVAIVTGASSGIGRAAAVALGRAGAKVAAVGRDTDRLRETAAGIAAGGGVEPLVLALDVRLESDMQEMARATLARWGRIDILVAAAGIGRADLSRLVPVPVARLATAEWDAILDTNLRGVFLSNRAVLPAMIDAGAGDILNIGSARAGVHGTPFAAAYAASKRAMVAFSECLAEEAAPAGIRVQVVMPDLVRSPILKDSIYGSGAHATLDAAQVADLILDMLALPDEAAMPRPLLAPLTAGRPAPGEVPS